MIKSPYDAWFLSLYAHWDVLDSGPPTANYHINGRHNDIQRWTFCHEGLFI